MSNEEEGATRSKEPRGGRSNAEEEATRRKKPRGGRSNAEEGATRRKEPRGGRSHEEKGATRKINIYMCKCTMTKHGAWSMRGLNRLLACLPKACGNRLKIKVLKTN